MLTEIDIDIRAMLLDDESLQEFVHHLGASKRKTAKLDEIWSAFCSVYDDLPQGRERRTWLRVVLDELDGSEEITLPVSHGKQWDRTSDVPLPTRIKLCSPERSTDAIDWRSYAWNPQLEWLFDRRHVSAPQVDFLLRVNQGLKEGWFEEIESLKYRSLQLTGNEKRLAKFAKTKLFGPGRLTLKLLACESELLPLAYERFGPQATMLVFENAAPFVLARSILSESAAPAFGCIAYGAGKQMLKSVGYLASIKPAVKTAYYVGDLDADGIQILSDCRRLSEQVVIQPATEFHKAMISAAKGLGAPNGWPAKEDYSPHVTEKVLANLDCSVRAECAMLIERSHRIPEEVLSRKTLRQLLLGQYPRLPKQP